MVALAPVEVPILYNIVKLHRTSSISHLHRVSKGSLIVNMMDRTKTVVIIQPVLLTVAAVSSRELRQRMS